MQIRLHAAPDHENGNVVVIAKSPAGAELRVSLAAGAADQFIHELQSALEGVRHWVIDDD